MTSFSENCQWAKLIEEYRDKFPDADGVPTGPFGSEAAMRRAIKRGTPLTNVEMEATWSAGSIFERYIDRFGNAPPMTYGSPYSLDELEAAMEVALKRGKRLRPSDFGVRAWLNDPGPDGVI